MLVFFYLPTTVRLKITHVSYLRDAMLLLLLQLLLSRFPIRSACFHVVISSCYQLLQVLCFLFSLFLPLLNLLQLLDEVFFLLHLKGEKSMNMQSLPIVMHNINITILPKPANITGIGFDALFNLEPNPDDKTP